MTSWEVSRHPEWDMMYAAGLTVREIADRCHGKVATIRLHLRVRQKYAPELHTIHAIALASRGPDRPSTQWRQRLSEALIFQETHHRLPRYSPEGVERSLARWVATQRNLYLKGRLSATKVILLDPLRGWEANPQQQRRDEHWYAMLGAFNAFVASTGQMPRYKNPATEHERALGVWLHVQHQRRAEKNLQLWRLDALNVVAPFWRSRS